MALIGGLSATWWSNTQAEVRVTRAQLYDLAWSAPMRQLAGEFGISDSGLAKAFRQQGIPLPDRPHRALQALLRRDERRYEKITSSAYPSWELAPVFDQPHQERKLRLVNTLMHALARLGYSCSLWGEREPSFRAIVGDHEVHVRIQYPNEVALTHRRHGDAQPDAPKTPLRIELLPNLPEGFPRLWEDGAVKLEAQIAEIVAAIVAAGEARYRLSIAERLERETQMNAWREERRQEELAKRNKERLEALHRSAEMLRQAETLRALIASVSDAIEKGHRSLDPIAFEKWREWAAAEADRLDPVMSRQVDEHLLVNLPEPSD